MPDDTSERADVQDAAKELITSLNEQEREIAYLRAQGYTRAQIREQFGILNWQVNAVLKRLKVLRHLLPDPRQFRQAVRTKPACNVEHAYDQPSSIDRQIAKMLSGGPKGSASMYADDYTPEKRRYRAEEDVRGKLFGGGVVEDYEGNQPIRRLLVSNGKRSWWLAEEFIPHG